MLFTSTVCVDQIPIIPKSHLPTDSMETVLNCNAEKAHQLVSKNSLQIKSHNKPWKVRKPWKEHIYLSSFIISIGNVTT
jgi:hypothetical protein